MLYPDQALSQPDALAFCKAKHDAAATLPPAEATIMAAARNLVLQAQVRGRGCALAGTIAVGSCQEGDP